MGSSPSDDQARSVIDYPVEIVAPDIGRWQQGNTGTPFVHVFEAEAPGPHLMLTAVVHGNEPAGAVALDRLLAAGLRPARGRLTLAFANVDAYSTFDPTDPRASRWLDEDMNRVWAAEILNARPPRSRDVARAAELRPFVDAADILLDLHTMQHSNEPLVLAGELTRSRALARSVGLTDLVVMDRGHAQGPRMRDYAGFGDPASHQTALLIECGQHWEARSGDIAYSACLRMLDRLGLLAGDFDAGPTVDLPEQASRFVEITLPVTIKRHFTFAMPLRGGEIFPQAGTLIGHDGDEPIVTPHDDCIAIMPSQRLTAGLTAVRLGRLVAPPDMAALPLGG